ncbi:hypothetical protein KGO95_02730 [Patescibacteria group bacterium]|nr:hypothetical protein [Patescibacteria group bacterium]
MEQTGSQAMMYCAYPTRLWKTGGGDRIIEYARQKGFAPVNPFNCGDFRDFEGGLVGREGTLQWTLHLQRGCYWTGYFGISEGVMRELQDRLCWDKNRHIRIFYEDDAGKPFDPLWHQEYDVLKAKYGDLLADVRGKHTLYAFVGPRAVGKTYWIDRILQERQGIGRIKNTTTRPPRNNEDRASYRFIERDAFMLLAAAHDFLEHVQYEGHLYGSSLSAIRTALCHHDGIFAVTPDGAKALYQCRYELNVRFVLLKTTPEVLLKNLEKRGITDPQEQFRLIQKADEFTLPSEMPHETIILNRDASDAEKVFGLFR